MTGAHPWCSVITVVRNDEKALRHTVRSVASQTLVNGIEHLILDGASTDGTVAIGEWAVEAYGARLRSERDGGIYNAMNSGLAWAAAPMALFLNAGDAFHDAQALERARDAWTAHSFSWGRWSVRFVDGDGRATRPLESAAFDRTRFLRGRLPVFHQGAVMSADLLRGLGGFDESLRIVADYDIMRRAVLAGVQPWVCDEPLVDVDSSGISTQQWRRSLWELHRTRTLGANRIDRATSALGIAGSMIEVGLRRGARTGAERVLGRGRVSGWRARAQGAASASTPPGR